MTDMIVAGAGSSVVNGTYIESGTLNGKPYYDNGNYRIFWPGSGWGILNYVTVAYYYRTADIVATPDLVTTWTVYKNGILPVPTVTAASSAQNLTLTCAAGSYSLTGTNADLTVKRNYVLACSAGSYTITGTNADITSSRTLICEPASGGAYPDIIVSGAGTTDANGTYTYAGTYSGKAYYENGSNLIAWYDFAGVTLWSISIDGNPVYASFDDVATPDLVTTWELNGTGQLPVPTVAAGTSLGYILTGSSASFEVKRNFTLACASGSYSLTGTNAAITSARTLAMNAGNYAITGAVAGLFKGLVMPCGNGSYALTGTDAGLNANYVFALNIGSYVMVGTAAGLFILTATPDCRTYFIDAENRTLIIGSEDRTHSIDAENRTMEVRCH